MFPYGNIRYDLNIKIHYRITIKDFFSANIVIVDLACRYSFLVHYIVMCPMFPYGNKFLSREPYVL